ncbi:LytR/AlgR family response regulator transcription factor [Nocardia sp. CDC160]|uniref:LytR/AlgR family response regulator transcription factor n=1 Tax=Nocardia sp. CDC160 TaxID=3112166 RepID=UPI002DBB289A|nr:LytTR family DNA-binding domain-containing protein [Nocardia sp. CDC160]MEC3915791.1 LytTR family DNA-binding domain-containing protein [Nocardia sp. CDC160]
MSRTERRLRVLAVDDVPSALDDLARLLREAPEVAEVALAGDSLAALKRLQGEHFDAVFLDISMSGLDGLELANLLARLSEPPVIVFVTAHDSHAATAYGIGAVDYVLKPVRVERLSMALSKVMRMLPEAAPAAVSQDLADAMAALPVESAGRTRYVHRDDVGFVEAQGDYVRLHTASGAHLVRMSLSRLEEYWGSAGFVRTHRGYLVALDAIRELRTDSASGLRAHTDLGDVPVSRRHARDLRERLLSAARRSASGGHGRSGGRR